MPPLKEIFGTEMIWDHKKALSLLDIYNSLIIASRDVIFRALPHYYDA